MHFPIIDKIQESLVKTESSAWITDCQYGHFNNFLSYNSRTHMYVQVIMNFKLGWFPQIIDQLTHFTIHALILQFIAS